MREANLVELKVRRVPIFGLDHPHEFRMTDFHPIQAYKEDATEAIQETSDIEHRHIMDVYQCTEYGKIKENYIVYSPELEELLGIPCDLMHKQTKLIAEQTKLIAEQSQTIEAYRSMSCWQRIKFLFMRTNHAR